MVKHNPKLFTYNVVPVAFGAKNQPLFQGKITWIVNRDEYMDFWTEDVLADPVQVHRNVMRIMDMLCKMGLDEARERVKRGWQNE